MIEIIKQALNDYTAYELAKAIGVSPQSLQKYKNNEAGIENMRLGTALAIIEFKNKEETKMKKQELIDYIESFEHTLDNEQNTKITGLTNNEVSNLKFLLWHGDLFISTKDEYIQSLEDIKADLEDEAEIESMEEEIEEAKGLKFDLAIERSGIDGALFI